MNGKLVGLALILPALLVGGGIWYTQEFLYYDRIDPETGDTTLTVETPAGPQQLQAADFDGIDADSSPIRWRACATLTDLPADAEPYANPQPSFAPFWFRCFQADEIGHDLETGAAKAYLSQSEIRPNVDRVLAVYPDGRIFGWHQYNDKSPERGVMD